MSQVQPGTNLKTTSRSLPWITLIYIAFAVGVGVSLVITWPGGEYQSVLRINNTMIRLLYDHAAPCQPQMVDHCWHVDLEGLRGKCAAYEDRYRAMEVFSDPSSYRCRYGNGWDQPSPLPQFRVLGERHSGTNGTS